MNKNKKNRDHQKEYRKNLTDEQKTKIKRLPKRIL